MKVMLFPTFCRQSGGNSRFLSMLVPCLLVAVGMVLGAALWAGYQMGRQAVEPVAGDQMVVEAIEGILQAQRKELAEEKKKTQDHLDALALRLGGLQSEMLRLEALGGQLVKLGDLDAEEFNFDELPARGGVEGPNDSSSVEFAELIVEMEGLSRAIDDRAHKLELMQGLILDGRIQEQLRPQGRPVNKGWISSRYGYRKDPFSGKKTFHHGVDIAGKKDSEVFAVASGVVTEAKRKSGYGYFVEIAHADGLVTRYAHNSKIVVKVGDLISKGDSIGFMGSTGRSTGPHVHFEIAKNGKSINPEKYLRTK